jgi:hypothetical protein
MEISAGDRELLGTLRKATKQFPQVDDVFPADEILQGPPATGDDDKQAASVIGVSLALMTVPGAKVLFSNPKSGGNDPENKMPATTHKSEQKFDMSAWNKVNEWSTQAMQDPDVTGVVLLPVKNEWKCVIFLAR